MVLKKSKFRVGFSPLNLSYNKNTMGKKLFTLSIVALGITSIILISAWKPSTTYNTPASSNELDFLDIDLNQLSFIASIDLEKKKYREAANKYLIILHHNPNDIPTLYNIAKCYANIKKPNLAVKALNHAIDAGMQNIDVLDKDSSWNQIRESQPFKALLDKVDEIKTQKGEIFLTECKVFVKGMLRKPDNYDSTKAYPLIIILHGNGGNPESYMPYRDLMGATDFFVAAPQGPYPRKLLQLNKPSYSWFYQTSDKKLWEKLDQPVIDYVIKVANEIKSQYKISNIYLLGHSQGGALAYMTGISKPDEIKGIICFGASNPKDYVSNNTFRNASSKLSIFIGHGWYDKSVDYTVANETKQMLINYGFAVTMKPFKGGHELNHETLIEAKNWINNIEK